MASVSSQLIFSVLTQHEKKDSLLKIPQFIYGVPPISCILSPVSYLYH